MPSPSHEERICAMFDSFVKTVARNCVRNLQRDEANRSRHIADEPVEYLLELLGREDDYLSDSYVLYVDGYPCVVESETLYKALQSLPDKQRKVLLLDFWRDRSDKEIAREMEVTPRTVYNMRQRAYKAIRDFYERERLYPRTEL